MNEKEWFIQEVVAWSPVPVKPFAKTAAKEVFEILQGRVSQKQVSRAVMMAGKFADLAKTLEAAPIQTFKMKPGSHDLIRQRQLIQRLTPNVKGVRGLLFGTDSAPFSSREDAEEWIEKTASDEHPGKDSLFGRCQCGDSVVFLSKRREVAMRIRRLRYERLTNSGKVVVKTVEVSGVGGPFRIYVSDLSTIETQTKQWAQATGFSQAALVTWLLTDIPPTRDPIVLEIWRGRKRGLDVPDRYWAKIQMNSLHVTRERWMILRRDLRQHLGITKSKRLTSQDERLLRIIDDLGGAPEKRGTKLRFWKRILREYGEHFPRWRSPHTPRRQYKRIKVKLALLTEDTKVNLESRAKVRPGSPENSQDSHPDRNS